MRGVVDFNFLISRGIGFARSRKIVLLCFSFFLIENISVGQSQSSSQNHRNSAAPVVAVGATISLEVFDAAAHTYGYNIFVDRKLLIHQPTIPCLQGQEGFLSKNDAQQVGQLMIAKMKNGEMPPTVTLAEMKNLKIKFP